MTDLEKRAHELAMLKLSVMIKKDESLVEQGQDEMFMINYLDEYGFILGYLNNNSK